MSKPGNVWRRVRGRIVRKPTNFSWVIGGQLAGSGMPTSSGEFDWIVGQGVRAVVTMTEDPLPEEWTGRIDYLHVPTPDLTAPDMDEIDSAVGFIHGMIGQKKPVVVHCAAGMGRAGTILACYCVKHLGCSGQEAIERIRGERPGSIQSRSQEMAVVLYEKHARG